jgi:uncharacterized protein (DUF4415 family)
MRLYLFRQWYDFIRKIRPVSYGYSFENLLALLHDHAPAKAIGRRAAPPIFFSTRRARAHIDRDVLDYFQEAGPGWQERINEALRKAAGK